MNFQKEHEKNRYMVEWFMSYKKKVQTLKEFDFNSTYPYRSFPPQVVEFIFRLANECGMDNTVRYSCVELYDRFLSGYFIHKYKHIYTDHPNEWFKILKQSKKQSYLRILSCMQLISKLTLQSMRLKLKDVKNILKHTGYNYTKKNILSSEIKVFYIVGYELNEPSIFTLVEYFIDLMPFDITETLYSTCVLITDFVYIYQQKLYNQLHHQKTRSNNHTHINKLELHTEFDKIKIAAVIVVTAFYILDSADKQNEEICEYLSKVCEVTIDELLIISSVLVSIINSVGN